MKIGVFHSNFNTKGGAEEVAYSLARALDVMEIYSIFSNEGYDKNIKVIDVSKYLPGWMRATGKVVNNLRTLEFWPWEMIDVEELEDFDVILSSGVGIRSLILPEYIMHVNYLHTIPRWLYDLWHYNWKRSKAKNIMFASAEIFRQKDRTVDSRVDHYFVNSELIKRRLWKYHKRDSEVLYPPLHLKNYTFREYGDFILHIGRFAKEKQIHEVIKSCEVTNTKLILIGDKGSDKKAIEYANRSNVAEYLGYVSREEKIELLSECKALIYNPLNEDFGIGPIEAFASGKPVIVNNTGYPPIPVRKTGLLANNDALDIYRGGIITNGSVESIASAISILDKFDWNPNEIKVFAKAFDFEIFKENLIKQLKSWKNDYDKFLD
jgi:glycosyltransferase involved in cell wall biosynthesis